MTDDLRQPQPPTPPENEPDDMFTEFEYLAVHSRPGAAKSTGQGEPVPVSVNGERHIAPDDEQGESQDEPAPFAWMAGEESPVDLPVTPSQPEAEREITGAGDLLPGEEPDARQRLRMAIFRRVLSRKAAQRSRLDSLSRAIALNPETAANYVLRGELYLKMREYALAAEDFARAVELASPRVMTDEWGLVAQSVQDRALIGLAKARKNL